MFSVQCVATLQHDRENESYAGRNFSCMNGITFPSTRMVYLDDIKELGQGTLDLGVDRTLDLAWERFYWPHMRRDVEHHIGHVCQYVEQKTPTLKTRAPLKPITATSPLELIAIDFLHLEKSSRGYEYILVVMDHFTRYVQAYTTRNKSAKTVAQKLYNDFIVQFGFPLRIHHDQGGEFENRLHRELKKLCDVEHSRTTPYHPDGNG